MSKIISALCKLVSQCHCVCKSDEQHCGNMMKNSLISCELSEILEHLVFCSPRILDGYSIHLCRLTF